VPAAYRAVLRMVCLWILLRGSPVAAEQPAPLRGRVVILLSGEAEPYQAALAGFRDALRVQAPEVTVEVIGSGDAGVVRRTLSSSPAPVLVLSLGTPATREAVAQAGRIPVVAGMILHPREIAGHDNATGVYLEHSAETEVRWLTQLLPGQRRVGIIYHSEANVARVEEARRAATRWNLSIQAIRIESAAQLPAALEAMANRTDVILGLTDPTVFNTETVRPLLMFSFQNRIPIVGPSGGWVRAGAVYALERDFRDVGEQSAELALRILRGQSPRAIPPQPPRKVDYFINGRTAGELNIQIPRALLQAAQEVVR
jgi:putative tryptophan/tyrosine transport system substrate-binding protein